MTLPNFLIIGAAKAGTSALFHTLRQHPQVYMSPYKEPKFFAFESPEELTFKAADGGSAPVNFTAVLERSKYEQLFDDARGELALGEASPQYLYVEKSPSRIRALAPQMKLVVILRNPIERAYSSYLHLIRDGLEPLDFGAALDAEPERLAQNYGFLYRYTDMGFYTDQLARYDEAFPRDQLLVLLHDDLRSDPAATYRRLFQFLGVDDSFNPPTSEEPNRSGVPRNRALHRLLNPSATVKRRLWDAVPRPLAEPLLRMQTRVVNRNLERQPMPEPQREWLRDVFRDEITRLERRLETDLSHWI